MWLISFLAIFSKGSGLKLSGLTSAGTPPAPANSLPVQDAPPLSPTHSVLNCSTTYQGHLYTVTVHAWSWQPLVI